MNGATKRLRGLRIKAESLERILGEAEANLTIIDRIIKAIRGMRGEIDSIIQDLRNMETLAGEDAWRLMAQYDEVFMREFLDNADPRILKMALRDIRQETRGRIRDALSTG